MTKRTSLPSLSLIISASFLMCACVSPPEQPSVEQPPPPDAVQPQATLTDMDKPEPALKLPPPSPSDVRNAIERVYKNAVLVDSSRFVVGDFNGDGVQDIAVAVKPAEGMLA